MHLFILVLSYAFSIWMLVDAYKRGAQAWWIIIILVPFGELVYFFVVKIHDYAGITRYFKATPRFKCTSCRHCVTVFSDGVMCDSGGGNLFMNPSQISFCSFYEPR